MAGKSKSNTTRKSLRKSQKYHSGGEPNLNRATSVWVRMGIAEGPYAKLKKCRDGEIDKRVNEIMAMTHPTPDNVDEYINETFKNKKDILYKEGEHGKKIEDEDGKWVKERERDYPNVKNWKNELKNLILGLGTKNLPEEKKNEIKHKIKIQVTFLIENEYTEYEACKELNVKYKLDEKVKNDRNAKEKDKADANFWKNEAKNRGGKSKRRNSKKNRSKKGKK